MFSPPDSADPRARALAEEAGALEQRGAHAEAAAVWQRAVEADPAYLPAKLGRAHALIRADRPAEALPVLQAVLSAAPANAAAWIAAGAANAMLGRHDAAARACARALALAPNVPAIHVGQGDTLWRAGDFTGAAYAYRRALELAPGDPDALNKLSMLERRSYREQDAEALLAKAIEAAPAHPYARVNLGLYAVQHLRIDEGRRLLVEALADPSLPGEARAMAVETLEMLDARDAMSAPIRAALESGDRRPIEDALRASAQPVPIDQKAFGEMLRILGRAAREPSIDGAFASGEGCSPAWPAIEAHHIYRFSDDPAALARSVALVAGDVSPASPTDVDILEYARAVRTRAADRPAARDTTGHDAWLRYTHARLTAHRPDMWPGLIKPSDRSPQGEDSVVRTPPREIAGTTRAVFAAIESHLRPGAWRAACACLAIYRMHPFFDSTKRLSRFVANHELTRAGLMPHVNMPGSRADFVRAVVRAFETGDPRPVAERLAAATHDAARLDARWRASASG